MSIEKTTPVLVTGAGGFVGKNLCAELSAQGFTEILRYDIDTPKEKLAEYAAKAGFVFHLAGVNRPKDPSEFYEGNRGLTEQLLHLLRQAGNQAPVLLTSSTQAALDNDYGKSKAEAEQLVYAHGEENGSPVYVFRLPGVFGKWCRPAYNSVVATFCHNIAHGLPIEVRDPDYSLPLVYIDDVVRCFVDAMHGEVMADRSMRPVCHVMPEYTITLGGLAKTIQSFKESRASLAVPDMGDEFCTKLYAAYLSYLPEDDFAYDLTMHTDDRGSFTEFLRTPECGQVSVNISRPGIVKGNHWHHTKNEKFLVVKGEGVIRFRKIGTNRVIEYRVSGEKLQVVDIPTGYTHNIENVGEGEMVTVMWASEPFDPNRPDTYFEKV